MSKAIQSILFVVFVAIASYVAFGIYGDWFQWMGNPYIKYPFFILGLVATTSRRNFFMAAATIVLEIGTLIILSQFNLLQDNTMATYFLMLAMVIPGGLIGLWLNKKFPPKGVVYE